MSMKKSRRAPMASGYSEAGASITRRSMKGFTATSGSPNEDITRNNDSLRQRSRILYMSSSVATAAINTNRTKIIGCGLALNAAIDRMTLGLTPEAAKDWQRKTEAEFRIWAGKKQNCDAIGMNTFDGLQQLALKSWLLSGDVFPVLKHYPRTPLNPYSLRIHLVEADRVRTPPDFATALFGPSGIVPENHPGSGHKVYDGVEVDELGQVVAYYISSSYPHEYSTGKDTYTRVEVYGRKTGLPNILHVMDSERPDQYRGVPYLAQVIEPLLQLRRYTESELMAALVQSFFTAWVETDTDPSQIPFNEVGDGIENGDGNEESLSEDQDDDESEYQLGPGVVTHLKPGEKVQFGNPNIPTSSFDAFIKTFCKQIGAALELPYDVLIKEFNSSYSASRGALLEAWEAFKMRRAWFVAAFCQPIYEVWLAEAVALGRIKAPGFFDDPLIRAAWCGANWIGPVQGQLDPLKEAKAANVLIDRGIKTHGQVTREMGSGDWETNIEQVTRENEKLAKARTAGKAPDPTGGIANGKTNEL